MAVDARRATQVAAGVVVVALALVALVLALAGLRGNGQINQLRTDGIAIHVKVTGCRGLLGGSGSNAAGYACSGSYTVHGRRYEEAIPGDAELAPGSSVRAVVSAADPALLSTPAVLATEHASADVFIAPSILGALALSGAVVLLRRSGHLERRRRGRATPVGRSAVDQAGGV